MRPVGRGGAADERTERATDEARGQNDDREMTRGREKHEL
jgi:hypothetical protein